MIFAAATNLFFTLYFHRNYSVSQAYSSVVPCYTQSQHYVPRFNSWVAEATAVTYRHEPYNRITKRITMLYKHTTWKEWKDLVWGLSFSSWQCLREWRVRQPATLQDLKIYTTIDPVVAKHIPPLISCPDPTHFVTQRLVSMIWWLKIRWTTLDHHEPAWRRSTW